MPAADSETFELNKLGCDQLWKKRPRQRTTRATRRSTSPPETKPLRGSRARLLEQNRGTEYLQKWLGEVRVQDLEDSELESQYTKLVPLATHADFEPFIQRIVDGDTISPILTQQPIISLTLTTGTTEGRHKYIPFTSEYIKIFLKALLVESTFRSRAYPTKKEGKILSFWYNNTKSKSTKGGLSVASIATHLMNNFSKTDDYSPLSPCCPWETFSTGEYKQLTYCHLLLGLHFSEKVETIYSGFAYAMVQALASFEGLWRDICRDIREGTVSPMVECPKLRKAVLDILKSPNPSLASEVEEKCRVLEGSGWFGLIPNLWPNAKCVCGVMTGSMQIYLKRLRHYASDLPLVCNYYATSESFIGFNTDPCEQPESVSFTLFPSASYFEFIPLHQKLEKQVTCGSAISGSMEDNYAEDEPIPISQLKVGQEYDIVLTTFNGLYRYKLGDVVRVVGFYKKTPKLKYVRRRKVLLSVTIDKTTESELQIGVERGSELLGSKTKAELVDFSSHADVANQPGHYVIYWEIKRDHNDQEEDESSVVLQECCTEMDKMFVDLGYVMSRRTNAIGPLELCIVERGTFKRVLGCFVENGGNVSQFKAPRCINNHVMLGILKACTIKTFHSTAYGN